MKLSSVPKTHLFTNEDLRLFDLPQIFSASATWLEKGMQNHITTFDLVIREMPLRRNFLLFGGLEEIIEGIRNWGYSKEDIEFLLKDNIITPKFAKYLKNFRFKGTVWAMPEGTVFFQKEPVVRITAPIIEANLLTMFLINAVTGNTKFLSKAIRCAMAAVPKTCVGFSGIRAESFESAMKVGRAAYICGIAAPNSVPAIARKYNLKIELPQSIAYHALIKSFPKEIEAMRAMAFLFKGKVNVMVDTYDFAQGVKNAIIVAKELQKKGMGPLGITIDSGDLFRNCVYARLMLDKAGLHDAKITVASNLDEYKILDLKRKKIPADMFMVVTEGMAISDAPQLEVVYKLTEIRKRGEIIHCAKFAPGKESYPGKKQVFRVRKNGWIEKDIVGLEEEKLGEPLLVEIIKEGKITYELPHLDEIRTHVRAQITSLPKQFTDIKRHHKFDVEISRNLKGLFEKTRKERRQEIYQADEAIE